MTTNNGSLESVKLEYEDMQPKEIKTRKDSLQTVKPIIVKRSPKQKRFNPIKAYFQSIVEVILA